MFAANLGLVLVVITWGSTPPILYELLQTWDPYLLSMVRFVMTSVVFFIWIWIAERRMLFAGVLPWREIFWVSTTLAGFTSLLTFAIHYSNPINIAVINAISPIVAAFVNKFLTGESPPRSVLLALPIVVIGGVFSGIDLDSFGNAEALFRFEPGDALMLLAVILWPTYSALLQRWFGDMSQLRRTALSFSGATVILLPCCLVLIWFGIESFPSVMPDVRGFGFLLWTSLGVSIFGTYMWNVGVKQIGIVVSSMFLNLIPLVAICVSMLFGIEPHMEQVAGAFLVILGVTGAQLGARRKLKASLSGAPR